MKNSFIPLLIIGLLLFAVFGLSMMSHMDGQGHSTCPFEPTGVADCFQIQNPLNFVSSHLNAFARFFSAIPTDRLAVLFSLVLLFALALSFVLSKDFGLDGARSSVIGNQLRESFVSPVKEQLMRWFALHENSPAFITGR